VRGSTVEFDHGSVTQDRCDLFADYPSMMRMIVGTAAQASVQFASGGSGAAGSALVATGGGGLGTSVLVDRIGAGTPAPASMGGAATVLADGSRAQAFAKFHKRGLPSFTCSREHALRMLDSWQLARRAAREHEPRRSKG
jgi:hypothetical protein